MLESAEVGQNSELQSQIIMSPDVDFAWSAAAPLLGKALEYTYNGITLRDIYWAIKEDRMQLWLAYDEKDLKAAAVTENVIDYRIKVCRGVVLGGTGLRNFLPISKTIEEWAKDEGCDLVELTGRRGWVRALMDYGYHDVSSTVVKRLNLQEFN